MYSSYEGSVRATAVSVSLSLSHLCPPRLSFPLFPHVFESLSQKAFFGAVPASGDVAGHLKAHTAVHPSSLSRSLAKTFSCLHSATHPPALIDKGIPLPLSRARDPHYRTSSWETMEVKYPICIDCNTKTRTTYCLNFFRLWWGKKSTVAESESAGVVHV